MGKNKNKKKPESQLSQSDQTSTALHSQSFSVLNQPQQSQQSVLVVQSKITEKIFSSDSQISISDFEDDFYRQKVNFTMKQWFHLGLSKLIPPSDKTIIIDLLKNEISGQKNKVQKFCKKAQNEIDTMVIKILKLKCQISPDTIMYEMDDEWRCQIFTVDLLKKVLEKLQKAYKLNEQMLSEVQSILTKDGVNRATRFLWVLNSAQESAVEMVKKIYREEKEKMSQSLGSSAMISKIEEKIPEQSRISRLKTESKVEEKSMQKFLQEDSDEFDFSALMVNANSKNPRKQAQIKSSKNKVTNNDKTQQFLKLLEDESELSIIQPREDSFEKQREQDQIGRIPRGNRIAPKRKRIFVDEYPEQYLDKDHLKKWIRGNKYLDVKDLEVNEKFSQEENQMYIEVIFYGDELTRDKQYALNLYFRYEKVFKLDPEDQELRKKLIEKFVSSNNCMKIEYKKIYTKQKFPKYETLKEFCKKDNSATKMYMHNKNITHVLYMIGLMTLIQEVETEIDAYIKEVKNTCRRAQIQLKFPQINEFMREKRVQEFIDACITEFISNSPSEYKLVSIKHIYNEVVVELELYGVAEKELKKTEKHIQEKLYSLVDFHELTEDGKGIASNILDSLSKKYLLFENSRNGITLIARAKEIKEQMVSINRQMKKNNQHVLRELVVKQKSEFAFSKDFILKKSQEKQFSSVKVRFEEGIELKIALYGQEMIVNALMAKLEEYLENLQGKIREFNLSLTDEELDIVEKDKQIQKHIETTWKITLKCNKNYSIGAVINVKPHTSLGPDLPEKTFYFERQFNFESLQQYSIFFFKNHKELDSIKQSCILPFKALINSKKESLDTQKQYDKQKKCFYLYKEQASANQVIEQSKKAHPNLSEVFMFLPQNTRNFDSYLKVLIKKICEDKDLVKKEIKITVICKKNQDLKKIINFKEGKHVNKTSTSRKWYTKQGANKLFYSEEGNKKIEQALQNDTKIIELSNSDLNLAVLTHQFDFTNKKMTHLQSGKQFPIEIHSNKITVNLNGVTKTIPDSEYQKIPKSNGFLWGSPKLTNCQLSIGFYQIDLTEKIQTNLFSKFKRELGYDEVEVKNTDQYNLAVNYDVKTNKLTLEYSDENQQSLKTAISYIKSTLQSKETEIIKPFDQDFTLELIGQFQDEAAEQNVKMFQSQDGKSAIFRAYNEKNIQNFVKMLTHLAKAKTMKIVNVQFPKEWEVQTQDIQTFNVNKNTVEFQTVQNAFTAGVIVQLIRIQNRTVFRKFSQEKEFLKELNGGKPVKQMLLFHGTKRTDPKAIYEDMQDCFNINYTSQGNLLGRGTYFAERSEYSVRYSYKEGQPNVYSMFYCQVMVGQSQKCLKHDGNIRDTDMKDQAKRIRYESMTDFLQGSNVFVVYKNRRAYPLYLIKYKRQGYP